MIPVSVVVMTRDEAVNLPACLEPLRRFTQVFVVDSASTDGTPEIGAAWGATVVPFRWDGRYPKKKQWCLDNRLFVIGARIIKAFNGYGESGRASMQQLCHNDA